MNSRQKGARGERQWRDQLREAGYTARRGQQFSGGTDSPDVVCEELGVFHFEVKCVQSLNVDRVMREQASKDAGPHKLPVIAHRKDRSDWLVTVRANDFFILLRNADITGIADTVKHSNTQKQNP
jgi:Holliday junction resolvase